MLPLTRFLNRATKDQPLLRRTAISAYAAATRLNVWRPGPRTLLNGPGKSGTHLLSDCLALLPRMGFSGRHFTLEEFAAESSVTTPDFYPPYESSDAPLDERRLQRYLRACPNGMFASAHAPWHPTFHGILDDLGFKQVLLFRDPRALIVSYVHFALSEPRHHHHRYFSEHLGTMEDRILALVEGIGRSEYPPSPRPPLAAIYAGYLRWVDPGDSVLMCRYEDLVGPQGGGTTDSQLETITAIATFLDRPVSEDTAGNVARRMYSTKSLTFRAGQKGGWEQHFTPKSIRAVDESLGGVIDRLGYQR